jgi:predicted Ser/Thr protein kinase
MTGPGVQDPTTVGPYRLVQRLGEGGMGVVHLALDPSGRAVALKLLRAHVASDPEARLRLNREVETLRRVRHARVAEVLDADVAGQVPYLVTRFVPGKTLDQHVRENGPLAPDEVAELGRGLAAALQAIHAAGVVHRDIKPANVMIVDGQPVLIDFGIAHLADGSRITMTGLVMGTPGYLSPEVVDGQPVSWATDWWGWAATLAFAASGRSPFGSGPLEAVLDRVRRGAADLDGVQPALRQVLQSALVADPRHRAGPGHLLAGLAAATTPSRTGPAAARAAAASDQTLRQPAPGRTLRQPTPSEWQRPAAAPGKPPTALPPPPAPGYGAPAAGHARIGTGTGQAVAPYVNPYGGPPPPGGNGHRGETGRSGPPTSPDLGRVPAAWQPPSGGPGPIRPTGTLLGALLALTGVGAVAPGGAVVIAAVLMVVARTVDRSATSLWRRRQDAGRRSGDVPYVVAALPWHLVQALVSTVLSLVLPALVGVSVAFIASAGAQRQGTLAAGTPNHPGALALAAAATLLTAWWGPGGGSLRRGGRAMARTAIRTPVGRAVVWAFLALVVVSVLVVIGRNQPPTMMFGITPR